jgi:ubiquinone/menaquinone biosynthesis C-methylase UbiE
LSSATITQPDWKSGFFDERADDYNREYNAQNAAGYALRVRREKVLRMFDRPGGKVLDVGCGPGPMAESIVNLGCSFWGVDPSQRMLEICYDKYGGDERMQFVQGDATRLDLPDCFFDAVLCMGVIDCVSDIPGAVREMVRVLKPGGTLITTFTNPFSPYAWWKKYVFYPAVATWRKKSRRIIRAVGPPDASKRTHFTRTAAAALLNSENADIVEIGGYHYNLFLAPLDELLPSLALRATRRLEESPGLRPEWICSGWIVKARKRSRHVKAYRTW